jgi:hypothetical protein
MFPSSAVSSACFSSGKSSTFWPTYRIRGKRQHRIKRDGAANIDQRDDTDEDSRGDDSVGWHVEAWVNLERWQVVSKVRALQSERSLTVPSHLEKGRPSSRAKANIWRELEAKALMVIMTSRIKTTLTKPVVPPTLSVAFWKT